MNGLVIGLMLLVVPGCYRAQTLDKTGTSGFKSAGATSQILKKQEPAGAGSFQAEREGFSDRSLDAGAREEQLSKL